MSESYNFYTVVRDDVQSVTLLCIPFPGGALMVSPVIIVSLSDQQLVFESTKKKWHKGSLLKKYFQSRL